MQRTLILVLTRKVWMPGCVENNFRNLKRFTDRKSAIKELKSLADEEFTPLGIRDQNDWVFQA